LKNEKNKALLFFLFNLFLEAMAEILNKIRWLAHQKDILKLTDYSLLYFNFFLSLGSRMLLTYKTSEHSPRHTGFIAAYEGKELEKKKKILSNFFFQLLLFSFLFSIPK
jgi:hypothetical protein